MNKTFTYGALTGIAGLALAVPVLAQVPASSSADTSSIPETIERFAPRALTQAQVRQMADRDQTVLDNIDAMTSILKTDLQEKKTALSAAASIVDDDARNEAVKAAHDAFRAAMESAVEANPDLKGMMLFGGGHGMRGGPDGHMKINLAEKLGMTETELKAAVDSGKTIEEIAAEKGVTLPARPEGRGPGMFGERGPKGDRSAPVTQE